MLLITKKVGCIWLSKVAYNGSQPCVSAGFKCTTLSLNTNV